MKELRNLLISPSQEINERLAVIWLLLMELELQRKSYCVLLHFHPKYLHIHEIRLKLILRAAMKVECKIHVQVEGNEEIKGRNVGLPSCLKEVRETISQFHVILNTFVSFLVPF